MRETFHARQEVSSGNTALIDTFSTRHITHNLLYRMWHKQHNIRRTSKCNVIIIFIASGLNNVILGVQLHTVNMLLVEILI